MSEESEGIEDLILRLEGIAKKMHSDGWYGDAIDVRDAIYRLRKTCVRFPKWYVHEDSKWKFFVKRTSVESHETHKVGWMNLEPWTALEDSFVSDGVWIEVTEGEALVRVETKKFPQWIVKKTLNTEVSRWCMKRLDERHCLYYSQGGAAEECEWDGFDDVALKTGTFIQTTEAEAMSRVIEPADVVTVTFHKYVVWQNGGLKNWVVKEKGWELNQVDWHNVRDLGVFETVEVQE